jgi:hypothetical protein
MFAQQKGTKKVQKTLKNLVIAHPACSTVLSRATHTVEIVTLNRLYAISLHTA